MTQDIYDHLPSWPDFTDRVLAILVLSLEMLHQMEDLPTGEKELNLHLSRCIRRANMQLAQERRGVAWQPSFDGIQAMSAYDEELSGYEETRPDCRFSLMDLRESNPLYQEKHLDIECKCLGSPSSPSWNFNKNYIVNGVLRFMHKTHSYGRNVDRGVMIGYIQSMEPDDILLEINKHGKVYAVTSILRIDDEWRCDISRLCHSIDRELEISPFQLDHFWIDIRKHSS